MDNDDKDILAAIYRIVLERKANPSEKSYTASLMNQGIDKVLKKVGEESAELIIAGKGGNRGEVVYEAADLFFHTLILLGMYDIPPEDIYRELRRRFGMSGLEEKASRSGKIAQS